MAARIQASLHPSGPECPLPSPPTRVDLQVRLQVAGILGPQVVGDREGSHRALVDHLRSGGRPWPKRDVAAAGRRCRHKARSFCIAHHSDLRCCITHAYAAAELAGRAVGVPNGTDPPAHPSSPGHPACLHARRVALPLLHLYVGHVGGQQLRPRLAGPRQRRLVRLAQLSSLHGALVAPAQRGGQLPGLAACGQGQVTTRRQACWEGRSRGAGARPSYARVRPASGVPLR